MLGGMWRGRGCGAATYGAAAADAVAWGPSAWGWRGAAQAPGPPPSRLRATHAPLASYVVFVAAAVVAAGGGAGRGAVGWRGAARSPAGSARCSGEGVGDGAYYRPLLGYCCCSSTPVAGVAVSSVYRRWCLSEARSLLIPASRKGFSSAVTFFPLLLTERQKCIASLAAVVGVATLCRRAGGPTGARTYSQFTH